VQGHIPPPPPTTTTMCTRLLGVNPPWLCACADYACRSPPHGWRFSDKLLINLAAVPRKGIQQRVNNVHHERGTASPPPPRPPPCCCLLAGHLSTGGSFAISSGSSSWGWSFEVITSSRSFFYTHVADPLAQNPTTGRPWGAGESVRKGQLLGWVAAHPTGGTIHLHFATREGNPCDYLRGCMGVNGMGPDSTLSKC
jgi:hypothetical protein